MPGAWYRDKGTLAHTCSLVAQREIMWLWLKTNGAITIRWSARITPSDQGAQGCGQGRGGGMSAAAIGAQP